MYWRGSFAGLEPSKDIVDSKPVVGLTRGDSGMMIVVYPKDRPVSPLMAIMTILSQNLYCIWYLG